MSWKALSAGLAVCGLLLAGCGDEQAVVTAAPPVESPTAVVSIATPESTATPEPTATPDSGWTDCPEVDELDPRPIGIAKSEPYESKANPGFEFGCQYVAADRFSMYLVSAYELGSDALTQFTARVREMEDEHPAMPVIGDSAVMGYTLKPRKSGRRRSAIVQAVALNGTRVCFADGYHYSNSIRVIRRFADQLSDATRDICGES